METLDTRYTRSGVATDLLARPQRVIKAALCAKFCLLLILAFNTQFVMDEFWQFGQSKYLGDGFFDTIWPAKAVGYAVFYKPAHWLGWDAASSLLIGRLQTALLAFGTLALLYAIARALGQSRLQALLVVLLVLSFSTFIERIFRTRSEPLALFFATAALYWIASRDTERVKTILIAGCLSGVSFLATQKAVYFNVSLGLGLTVVALSRRDIGAALVQGAALVVGWAIPVFIYCIVFGGWDALEIFTSLFKGPVEVATNGHVYYTDLNNFYVQTVERNLVPYLLGACGLVVSLFQWRTLVPVQKIVMIFTLVMIVLIARHNQPWPYVFIMVIPFLALWAPTTLEITKGQKSWSTLVYVLWIVAILISFGRNVSYIENDNRAGLETMRQAEKLLDPSETYFDGIGMLSNFRESQRRWLDARQIHIAKSEGERSDVMKELRATSPHLIIETYRTHHLRDLLKPFLERSYIRVAPNIQVPGALFSDARGVTFDVPLEQEFGLFDRTGTPVQTTLFVEGKPVKGSVALRPGPIRLRLDEGADWPVFLLPAHKTYSTLDPEPVPVPLFGWVYDY